MTNERQSLQVGKTDGSRFMLGNPYFRLSTTYGSRTYPTLREPLSGNGNSKDCGKGYSARSRFASTPNAERKPLATQRLTANASTASTCLRQSLPSEVASRLQVGKAQGRAASPPRCLPNALAPNN